MRVLVTGASGLIGSNVAAAAAQQSWDVLGCYHEHPVELPCADTLALPMVDRKACVKAALEWEPDVIVHAAGLPSLTRFERDPFAAQLDFVGAEHTLAAARAVRARYVLVSCDGVHSGYRPAGMRFEESDLPDPVNACGRSKLACEEAVMRSNTSWLITRLGDPYGVNLSTPLLGHRERHAWERLGLALALVKRLRDRAPLPAPPGVWRTSTYAWDYAQRLCELVAQGCEGVYNMGGPRSLGRREWAELLAHEFGCSRELVREGTAAAFLRACGEDPGVRVPFNLALSDTKARAAIGFAAIPPEHGVKLMREQLLRLQVPAGVDAR
jgi:dTDP-4-dehydrorhamnose reductase